MRISIVIPFKEYLEAEDSTQWWTVCPALWIAFYPPPPTHTHTREWLTLWRVYSLHLHSMISITPRDLNRLIQSLLPTLPITTLVLKSIHLPFLDDKKYTPGIFHTGDKPVMLLKQKQWANNWNRWWASEWTHPRGIQLLETFERWCFCDEFIL